MREMRGSTLARAPFSDCPTFWRRRHFPLPNWAGSATNANNFIGNGRNRLNRGLTQYCSLKNPNSCGDVAAWRTLVASTQGEVTHLPLDPSGIAPIPAGSGGFIEDFLQHRVVELFSTPRGE